MSVPYWVCFDKNYQAFVVICHEENPHDAPANCGWGLVTVAGPFPTEQEAAASPSLETTAN